MPEKRRYKASRLPAELAAKVDKLAAWLYENGFQSYENYSAALVFALRRADKAGLLDPPDLDPRKR